MADANDIVRDMGFPDTEQGPFVTKLREYIAQEVVKKGLRRMSGGTWAMGTETMAYEERARLTLQFMWEADHFSYKVECLDGKPWGVKTIFTKTESGEWSGFERKPYVKWRRIPAFLRDCARRQKHAIKVWWFKGALRVKNPYDKAR